MAFPKVTVLKELFQKIGQDDKGNYTTALTVSLIKSEGTYTPESGNNAGVETSYSKEKIQIVVSKLDYKTGAVKSTAKIAKNGKPYALPDEVKIQIDPEFFKEFLFESQSVLENI